MRCNDSISRLTWLVTLAAWLGCGLDEAKPGGPARGSLRDPVSVLCPAGGDAVVVLDRSSSALVNVATKTGALTLISAGGSVGTGPALRRPLMMAQGRADDSVMVLARDQDDRDIVLQVDLESGHRDLVVELAVAHDVPLGATANDMVLTQDGSKLLLADEQAGLVSIDLDSGERSPIGVLPGIAKGLANASDAEVWVALVGTSSFVKVALDTGAMLEQLAPLSGSPRDLVLVPDEHSAVALFGGSRVEDGDYNHGLRWVDLATADQEQISGGEQGTGPQFGLPGSFCVDAEREQAFVLDVQEHALFKVDLASGERAIVTRW